MRATLPALAALTLSAGLALAAQDARADCYSDFEDAQRLQAKAKAIDDNAHATDVQAYFAARRAGSDEHAVAPLARIVSARSDVVTLVRQEIEIWHHAERSCSSGNATIAKNNRADAEGWLEKYQSGRMAGEVSRGIRELVTRNIVPGGLPVLQAMHDKQLLDPNMIIEPGQGRRVNILSMALKAGALQEAEALVRWGADVDLPNSGPNGVIEPIHIAVATMRADVFDIVVDAVLAQKSRALARTTKLSGADTALVDVLYMILVKAVADFDKSSERHREALAELAHMFEQVQALGAKPVRYDLAEVDALNERIVAALTVDGDARDFRQASLVEVHRWLAENLPGTHSFSPLARDDASSMTIGDYLHDGGCKIGWTMRTITGDRQSAATVKHSALAFDLRAADVGYEEGGMPMTVIKGGVVSFEGLDDGVAWAESANPLTGVSIADILDKSTDKTTAAHVTMSLTRSRTMGKNIASAFTRLRRLCKL